MSTEYLTPDQKIHYINYKGKTIPIQRCEDGLWRDADGGVYAYAERNAGDDKEVRCGVGIFSLDKDNPLTPACAIHDYQYSSPAYQLFYTRADADADLKKNIKIVAKDSVWGLLAEPFKFIVRAIGSRYWDNKNTR